MTWNLTVLYLTSKLVKDLERRCFLSILNSVYDPLGFVALVLINGKILLREKTTTVGWDETVDTMACMDTIPTVAEVGTCSEDVLPRVTESVAGAGDICLLRRV